MSGERTAAYLTGLVHELRKLPVETEWVEFKRNNDNPEEIGEYLSALANLAALLGKVNGYMVWGVDDQSHDIVGTTFRPTATKIGNEELENWLLRLLAPKINFRFHEIVVDEQPVVLLEIGAARLNKKKAAGFTAVLGDVTEKYLAELQKDISWFCKKFDYRFQDEPWGNSKDAVERAIRFLRSDLHNK